ncbi:hypothetical protein N8G13_00190 [Mycoplasma zalophi]|uniref:ABC transporter permease subunit n=1 Tax=Mycoplasma zalophi TaxID=191287 RepID=UPI0021C88C54|nr:hypothetical protein [Mycoplasma zalophi]MCU4116888.1 hypothetical protein [Mycoplasma zalophi]
MKSFTSKLQNLVHNASVYIRMDQQKSSLRKIASSLWAIIMGILLSMIFISMIGKNPLQFFNLIFTSAFKSWNKEYLMGYLSIFLLGSLGVGLGFKSGYFNIGVSGQMMFGSLISFLIIFKLLDPSKTISAGYLVLLMFISIITGALLAMIAGLLKAFFNVHEVISTILLNWIVVYLCIYFFNWTNGAIWSDGTIAKQFLLDTGDGTRQLKILASDKKAFISAALGFGVIISLVLWFVFSKTTIGYKVKMVGLSKTNAKYSGTNEKIIVVSVLSISGALSGFAGFIYYVILQGQMVDLTTPLGLGFDTIAISLLALNAPVGIIFTSLFYALLKTGEPSLFLMNLNGESMFMVTGLIIFMAALSIMFSYFKPIYWMKKFILLYTNKEWLELKKEHTKKLTSLTKQHKLSIKEAKNEHKAKKSQFKEVKSSTNKEIHKLLLQKTDQYTEEQKLEYFNKLSSLKINLQKTLDDLGFNNLKNKINLYKSLKTAQKLEFKKSTENIYQDLSKQINKKIITKCHLIKAKGEK